eukprot:Awhi_evm1s9792
MVKLSCFALLALIAGSQARYNVVLYSSTSDKESGKFACLDQAVEDGFGFVYSRLEQEKPFFYPPTAPYPSFPGDYFQEPGQVVDCEKYADACSYYSTALGKTEVTWMDIVAWRNIAAAQHGLADLIYYKLDSEEVYRSYCKLDVAGEEAFNESDSGYPSNIAAGCGVHEKYLSEWGNRGWLDRLCTDEERVSPNQYGNAPRTMMAFVQNNQNPHLASDNPGHFRSNETYYNWAFAPNTDPNYVPKAKACIIPPLECDPKKHGYDQIFFNTILSADPLEFMADSLPLVNRIVDDYRAPNLSLNYTRTQGSAFLARAFNTRQTACPNGMGELFDQCGGQNHGDKCCPYGSKCVFKNEFYSQCQPENLHENEQCGGEGTPYDNNVFLKCDTGLVCKEVNKQYHV